MKDVWNKICKQFKYLEILQDRSIFKYGSTKYAVFSNLNLFGLFFSLTKKSASCLQINSFSYTCINILVLCCLSSEISSVCTVVPSSLWTVLYFQYLYTDSYSHLCGRVMWTFVFSNWCAVSLGQQLNISNNCRFTPVCWIMSFHNISKCHNFDLAIPNINFLLL